MCPCTFQSRKKITKEHVRGPFQGDKSMDWHLTAFLRRKVSQMKQAGSWFTWDKRCGWAVDLRAAEFWGDWSLHRSKGTLNKPMEDKSIQACYCLEIVSGLENLPMPRSWRNTRRKHTALSCFCTLSRYAGFIHWYLLPLHILPCLKKKMNYGDYIIGVVPEDHRGDKEHLQSLPGLHA